MLAKTVGNVPGRNVEDGGKVAFVGNAEGFETVAGPAVEEIVAASGKFGGGDLPGAVALGAVVVGAVEEGQKTNGRVAQGPDAGVGDVRATILKRHGAFEIAVGEGELELLLGAEVQANAANARAGGKQEATGQAGGGRRR